jgi:hypothetical protein
MAKSDAMTAMAMRLPIMTLGTTMALEIPTGTTGTGPRIRLGSLDVH